MTINDTVRRIEAYGQQLDTQVARLSEIEPPSLQTLEQIGGQPDARNVLMAMFVDQFAGAMARLRTVYRAGPTRPAAAAQRQAVPPVIDVTDYKEVSSDP